MKNKLIVSLLSLCLFSLATLTTNAQDFKDLDKSPMDASSYPSSHRISEKLVKVIYSRPQLKGRTVASLTPLGEVWRTGANEATEITFYNEVNFGGKHVKAGTYALFTIPGEQEWTIIISKDVDVWGAYSYNEANDVLRTVVPVSTNDKFIEAFCIAFDDEASMHLAWGNLRVVVPIKKL